MATLYHQLWIACPAQRLFAAISQVEGVASWWHAPRAVMTDACVMWEFRPGPEHGVLKMKIVEQTPTRRVEWKCVSMHPESSPVSAWTGTHIVFEISEEKAQSVLDFRHVGWDEHSPYFGFCNYHWGQALAKLKELCEREETPQ